MTHDDRRQRIAGKCGQLALLAESPLTRALDHLAAARAELSHMLRDDTRQALDLRMYHCATLLDDAATILGGAR